MKLILESVSQHFETNHIIRLTKKLKYLWNGIRIPFQKKCETDSVIRFKKFPIFFLKRISNSISHLSEMEFVFRFTNFKILKSVFEILRWCEKINKKSNTHNAWTWIRGCVILEHEGCWWQELVHWVVPAELAMRGGRNAECSEELQSAHLLRPLVLVTLCTSLVIPFLLYSQFRQVPSTPVLVLVLLHHVVRWVCGGRRWSVHWEEMHLFSDCTYVVGEHSGEGMYFPFVMYFRIRKYIMILKFSVTIILCNG